MWLVDLFFTWYSGSCMIQWFFCTRQIKKSDSIDNYWRVNKKHLFLSPSLALPSPSHTSCDERKFELFVVIQLLLLLALFSNFKPANFSFSEWESREAFQQKFFFSKSLRTFVGGMYGLFGWMGGMYKIWAINKCVSALEREKVTYIEKSLIKKARWKDTIKRFFLFLVHKCILQNIAGTPLWAIESRSSENSLIIFKMAKM